MKKYILKRLLLLLFLVFAVATMVFFLVHLVPGDPVVKILGEGADPGDVSRLRQELHLDCPLLVQYKMFISQLFDFSLGKSLFNQQKVLDNILAYFPRTLYLALAALAIALVFSLPMGAWAAFKENSPVDTSITFAASLGLAVPNFVWGPLLVIFFSIELGWLPVSGSETFSHLVLPALTLGTSMSAYLVRIVKAALAQELKKPYIVLARAKGLSEFQVFRRHLLKNALIPVVTSLGIQFGALLSGTVITESLFSWQGMGLLLVDSIHRRDFPMIQGLVVFLTSLYLVIHFLVDLAYFALDPRIKHEIEK